MSAQARVLALVIAAVVGAGCGGDTCERVETCTECGPIGGCVESAKICF